MARRIDIELTSARSDGTWTWRAAGALNPRGALDATLLYSGAKSGDVVRAEADFSIDGITIVSVEPPRTTENADPNRIELLDRPATAGVTTQLAPARGRPRDRERPGRSDRGERRTGERDGDRRRTGQQGRSFERPSGRGPGSGGGGAPGAQGAEPGDRSGRPPRPEGQTLGDAAATGRPGRPDRASRFERPTRPGAGPGRGGPARGAGRAGSGEGARHEEHGHHGPQADQAGRRGAPPRQHRLAPGNAHRNAMLESLPAEQQPIAQQLLRGGIPAVRTALHFEREKAREEGRPEPSTEGVLALAESLVSKVKAAEWRDRAEAALRAGDDLTMRDLRALVSGSDVARDEASRELVVSLRELLDRRVEAHRTTWEADVARNLDEGHVIRALRLSSRPPDAMARFSAELATRLRDAAGAALSSTTPSEQWLALLQAAAESPVRRTIKPQALPAHPSPELLDTARQQAGRVPGLAPLLGLAVPPPPGPARLLVPSRTPPRRPPRPARGGRPARSAPPGAPQAGRQVGSPDQAPAERSTAERGPAVGEAASASVTEPNTAAELATMPGTALGTDGGTEVEPRPGAAAPGTEVETRPETGLGTVGDAGTDVGAVPGEGHEADPETDIAAETEMPAAETEMPAAETEMPAAQTEMSAAEAGPVASEATAPLDEAPPDGARLDEEAPMASGPMMDVPPEDLPATGPVGAELTSAEPPAEREAAGTPAPDGEAEPGVGNSPTGSRAGHPAEDTADGDVEPEASAHL